MAKWSDMQIARGCERDPLGGLMQEADWGAGPAFMTEKRKVDPVTHPAHYTSHPSGVECLTITRHMNFNLGNAIKYIWRAGLKGDAIEDLRKAAFYIQDEIKRREGK